MALLFSFGLSKNQNIALIVVLVIAMIGIAFFFLTKNKKINSSSSNPIITSSPTLDNSRNQPLTAQEVTSLGVLPF